MHRLFPVSRMAVPLMAVPLMVATITLAACGTATPADDTTRVTTAPANGTDAAAVRALPPRQRDGVFLRAVRDSGTDCQQVTQAGEQRTSDGLATWAVECDRHSLYAVTIDPGGIATVTPAAAPPRR